MENAADQPDEEVVALLETLLANTTYRALPRCERIAFELGDAVWTLDAKRKGPLIARENGVAALRIRCTPQVLARLLMDPDFHLRRDEELAFEGNPLALSPVIEALSGGKNKLSIRFTKERQ